MFICLSDTCHIFLINFPEFCGKIFISNKSLIFIQCLCYIRFIGSNKVYFRCSGCDVIGFFRLFSKTIHFISMVLFELCIYDVWMKHECTELCYTLNKCKNLPAMIDWWSTMMYEIMIEIWTDIVSSFLYARIKYLVIFIQREKGKVLFRYVSSVKRAKIQF